MEHTYAVVYQRGDQKFTKKIIVTEKTKEAVLCQVRDKFGELLPADKELRLQADDADFCMLIDVDEDSSLPDTRGILHLFVVDRSEDSGRSHPLEDQFEANVLEADGESNESGGPEGAGHDRHFKEFPMVYRLPVFPPPVQNILNTNPSKVMKDPTGHYRHAIVQAIYDQCCVYENGYFGKYYDTIMRTLVGQYPALKDAAHHCNTSGGRYSSWVGALGAKCKAERKRLLTNEAVVGMRQKYGHMKGKKRTRQVRGGGSGNGEETGRAKRRKTRAEMQLAASAETPETMGKHVEALQKEYAKRDPNMDLIADRMDRTMELRAEWYHNKPVEEVLAQFPCLRDHKQVIADAKRFFYVDISCNRREWLSEKTSDGKTSRATFLQNLLKARNIAVDDSDEGIATSQVLGNLPVLFREDVTQWIELTPPEGPEPRLYRDQAGQIKLYIDGTCVNAVTNEEDAADAFVAWIFLLNLEYPPELRCTLRCLSEVMAKFKCRNAKLPAPLQTLLNKM